MSIHLPALPALLACTTLLVATGADATSPWRNSGWRYRTSISRAEPWREAGPRVIECAPDLQALLDRAGVDGRVDPASVRIVDPVTGRQLRSALRTEYDPRSRSEQQYLTCVAEARAGEPAALNLYFDTTDRRLSPPGDSALPPEELVTNGGFEELEGDLPAAWTVSEPSIASVGRSPQTVGERSLRLHVDADTPEDVERTVAVSQRLSVARYAGQEVRFACSLFPERGLYGTPMTVELAQFRADGSRIAQYAVQPRWMTVEMAEGQLVEFAERGRLDAEAATLEVRIRLRLYANNAWDGTRLTDQEREYTCWLDRISLRPGERWAWPGESAGCFTEGALEDAPINAGVDFRGKRRLVFNGASEGTLTTGGYDPNQRSVHWGPQRGTVEAWVRPHWSSADEGYWTLFSAKAYLHRLQSSLRVVGGESPALEFTIADSEGRNHTVRGPVEMNADQWHHVAATWDLPAAHLQLFLDGRRVGVEGPGDAPWPSTVDPLDPAITEGRGTSADDKRSIPMQAFIGGDTRWSEADGAEAVMDEFRVSDVVRYAADFEPQRREFALDPDTRALFHLDRERNGIHAGDDRFVQGYLACDEQPLAESAPLEVLRDGAIERRMVAVAPYASEELFAQNEPHSVLQVTRPIEPQPDPRFIEQRLRTITRTVGPDEPAFDLTVEGDLPPLMAWSRFSRAEGAGAGTTLIPRWRANDNVVPFSFASLKETLAPDATSDEERALEIFRYALKTTNYYDAGYCEDLGRTHRDRVSYTLIRALNIYPFDQCGPLNHMLRYLFIAGGISSNNSPGTHHQFEQCFYDGSLRVYDLSARQYWLARDNQTRLGLRQLIEDPWLKIRQEGDPNAWLPGIKSNASFGSVSKSPAIEVPLRPGERISFGWHNEGRWMELTGERKPVDPGRVPPSFGNGAVIWEPTVEGEAAEFINATIRDGRVVPLDPAQEASVTYRVRLPYVLADAQVSGSVAGEVALAVSTDAEASWRELWRGEGPITLDLREEVMNRYDYALRLTIPARSGAEVSDLSVRSVLIASPLSLPGELRLGENRMQFVAGPVTEPVEAELAWIERFRSDLGVSLNGLGFYLMDDTNRRDLFVARPGEELPVEVTIEGRAFDGTVTLEGLPDGWLAGPASQAARGGGEATTVSFSLRPDGPQGLIAPFEVVLRDGARERRIPAQVLLADAALVAEAEATELSGGARPVEEQTNSGLAHAEVGEAGTLAFTAQPTQPGTHALWLRMKLSEGGATRFSLRVDGEEREVRALGMIGFSDWTSPTNAATKIFAHYGEMYGHWLWWRLPEIELPAGAHRVEIVAGAGQSFDAVALLPQTQEVDRAAMNLLHTWSFAPWLLPM